MKIRCYPEGNVGLAESYEINAPEELCVGTIGRLPYIPHRLSSALQRRVVEYAKRFLSDDETHNVIVEPDDEEARELSGWSPAENADERPFRIFTAQPRVTVEWTIRERP